MMNNQHFYNEIKAHFCLRTNKTKKPEMVYLVVHIDGRQYKLSCGVKVYPSQWHKGMVEESNLISKRDNVNNKIANERLMAVLKSFAEFKEYLCNNDCSGMDIGTLLKSHIYKDSLAVKKIRTERWVEKSVVTLIEEAYDEFYTINNPSVKASSVKQNRSIHQEWFLALA